MGRAPYSIPCLSGRCVRAYAAACARFSWRESLDAVGWSDEAAVNLAAAATTMAESPGAMQLRTLQSIDGLGA